MVGIFKILPYKTLDQNYATSCIKIKTTVLVVLETAVKSLPYKEQLKD